MTRMMYPPERPRERDGVPFDPIAEGDRHRLSAEVSLALWQRICREASERNDPRDRAATRRRFRELAARLAARGGRLMPDVGRVTRVAAEDDDRGAAGDALADEAGTPGRDTLVASEARRGRRGRATSPAPGAPHGPHAGRRAERGRGTAGGHRGWLAAMPATILRSAERAAFDLEAADLALRSLRDGAPLDGALRARLEAALGSHLGDVRVHTGAEADAAARALGARAFAIRSDIFFRRDTYRPQHPEGQRLIAHEVAHTVQARGAAPASRGPARISEPGDALERAADAFADAFAASASPGEPRTGSRAGAAATSGDRSGERTAEVAAAAQAVAPGSAGPAPAVFRQPAADAQPRPQSGDGGTAPAGSNAPPAGSNAPPANSNQAPPAGSNAPPAGSNAPPATGNAPPAGSNAPPATGNAPPAGSNAPANHNAPPGQAPEAGAKQPGDAGSDADPLLRPIPRMTPRVVTPDLVKLEMLRRRDPAIETFWQAQLKKIDTYRISSISWSYNPTSTWHNVWQQFWPTDNWVDHFRVGFTNNPYGAGKDDTGQAIIEGLRGIVRLIGDTLGMLSNWTAGLSGVCAAIGIAGSETGVLAILGGIAAAVLGLISTALSILKLITDLIEIIIGLLQMKLLADKLKSCKDPEERKRLLALMKKEGADFSNACLTLVTDVVAVAIGLATLGVAEGAGAAVRDAMAVEGKSMAAMARAGIKSFAVGFADGVKEGAISLKNVAMLEIAREITLARAGLGAASKLIAGGNKNHVNLFLRADLTLMKEVGSKGIASLSKNGPLLKAAIGQVHSVGGANAGGALAGFGKARGAADSGPGKPGDPPAGASSPGKSADVTLSHIAAWPALHDDVSDMRGRIQNANIRMHRQYELAKGEVDDEATRQKIDAAFQTMRKQQQAQREAAQKHEQEADKDAQVSGQQAQDAQKAADKKLELDGKRDQAKDAGGQVQKKAEEGVGKTGGGGIFDAIEKKIGQWLTQIANGIMTYFLEDCHVTAEEAQVMGLPKDCLSKEEQDKYNKLQAQQTAQQADAIDDAVQKAQSGASQQQQYAIQSMGDALHWIEGLTELDDGLGDYLTSAAAYIAKVQAQIEHELDSEIHDQKIDAAYVAPITEAADSFLATLPGRSAVLKEDAGQAVDKTFQQLAASSIALQTEQKIASPVTPDFAQPLSACRQEITEAAGNLQGMCDVATSTAQAIRGQATGLVGSDRYGEALDAAERLEDLMKSFSQEVDQLVEGLRKAMQDTVNDAIKSIVPPEKPALDGQKPGAPGGANANPGGQNGSPTPANANPGGQNPGAPTPASSNSGAPDGGTPSTGSSSPGTPSAGTPDAGAGAGTPRQAP